MRSCTGGDAMDRQDRSCGLQFMKSKMLFVIFNANCIVVNNVSMLVFHSTLHSIFGFLFK